MEPVVSQPPAEEADSNAPALGKRKSVPPVQIYHVEPTAPRPKKVKPSAPTASPAKAATKRTTPKKTPSKTAEASLGGSVSKKALIAMSPSQKKKKIEELKLAETELERLIKGHRCGLTGLKKSLREKERQAQIAAQHWDLPAPSSVIAPPALPPSVIAPLVHLAAFLFCFSDMLRLTPPDLADLAEAVQSDRDSVALAETVCAMLRLILADADTSSILSAAIPRHASFASRGRDLPHAEEDTGAPSPLLALLPRKLRPEAVGPLTWTAVLRAVLPNLPAAQIDIAYFISSSSSSLSLCPAAASMLSPDIASGLVPIVEKDASLSFSHNPSGSLPLLLAIEQLKNGDVLQLSAESRTAVLTVLMQTCLDTTAVRRMMESHATDRAADLALLDRLSREHVKKRELSACRKAEVGAQLREEAAKGVIGGKKKKSSSSGGVSAQELAAAYEQAAVMDHLGIAVVLKQLPDHLIMDHDDESHMPRTRNQPLSHRRIDPALMESANDVIRQALSSGADADIKAAVKAGRSAGLKGEMRDGTVFCTDLMAKALVLHDHMEARERAAEESALARERLSARFLRVDPIGADRAGRLYWELGARLWVQTIDRAAAGDRSNGGRDATGRLLLRPPSAASTRWTAYERSRDLWAVLDRLSAEHGDESSLRRALQDRFDLSERPHEYKTDGHEWIGRKVKRDFGRGRNRRSVIGDIVGWVAPDGEDVALWHVQHKDGDEEDLEAAEVEAALVDEADDGTMATTTTMEESQGRGYVNSARGSGQVKEAHLGLAGLKTELVALMGALAAGLWTRGSSFGKEDRRMWELGVKAAATLPELRDHLLALERTARGVQTVADAVDEAEEERLQDERSKKMRTEGWLFLSDVAADKKTTEEEEDADERPDMMGSRCRRFFKGQGFSDGTIVAYLAGDLNEGVALWHMKHDDGDVEDLEADEMRAAIRDHVEGRERGGGGDGSEDDDDDDDEATDVEDVEASDATDGVDATLWPTSGVRGRWIQAVEGSRAVGELALATCAFAEQCKNFGLVDEALDNGRARIFASPKNKKRSSYGRSELKVSSSGRIMRTAATKVGSYREY